MSDRRGLVKQCSFYIEFEDGTAEIGTCCNSDGSSALLSWIEADLKIKLEKEGKHVKSVRCSKLSPKLQEGVSLMREVLKEDE